MTLINRSLALHERIYKLDRMITVQISESEAGPGPVNEQLDHLASMLKVSRG
jgi:hypothetical protein